DNQLTVWLPPDSDGWSNMVFPNDFAPGVERVRHGELAADGHHPRPARVDSHGLHVLDHQLRPTFASFPQICESNLILPGGHCHEDLPGFRIGQGARLWVGRRFAVAWREAFAAHPGPPALFRPAPALLESLDPSYLPNKVAHKLPPGWPQGCFLLR